MKPATRKKSVSFQRDPPDLPVGLDEAAESGCWPDSGDVVTIQQQRLHDLERASLKVGTLRIEGSVLDRVQLSGSEFGSVVCKDARLIGCDLANVRAHRIVLVRVELVDCRLTGFIASALEWQHVLIQNGDMRYAQLQGGKFRTCEFDTCNWQEADLQNADLTGCVVRSCDLTRADLHGAKLQNTDFRKSEVEGLLVGMNDLRGAIVDPSQAMVLARVLGLQII